jgi:hypothetical protein
VRQPACGEKAVGGAAAELAQEGVRVAADGTRCTPQAPDRHAEKGELGLQCAEVERQRQAEGVRRGGVPAGLERIAVAPRRPAFGFWGSSPAQRPPSLKLRRPSVPQLARRSLGVGGGRGTMRSMVEGADTGGCVRPPPGLRPLSPRFAGGEPQSVVSLQESAGGCFRNFGEGYPHLRQNRQPGQADGQRRGESVRCCLQPVKRDGDGAGRAAEHQHELDPDCALAGRRGFRAVGIRNRKLCKPSRMPHQRIRAARDGRDAQRSSRLPGDAIHGWRIRHLTSLQPYCCRQTTNMQEAKKPLGRRPSPYLPLWGGRNS